MEVPERSWVEGNNVPGGLGNIYIELIFKEQIEPRTVWLNHAFSGKLWSKLAVMLQAASPPASAVRRATTNINRQLIPIQTTEN